jgi:nitrate reductase gamma subunit
MSSQLDIAPEGSTGPGSGGGGPEDPGTPQIVLRTQGLLTLAVGFALGVAFMVLFWFIRAFGAPTGAVADFVAQINPNLWLSFLLGFVGGTVMSAIYNLLVVRRLNLFGLDSSVD